MNCERNRNKTKIFFAKALFAFIAKKNRVWHLQRNWKFCTYKFFVFVTLFAPKTCNSFCVTKNVTYQRNYSWSCSPNNMTQRSIPLRNKDFCCLTKIFLTVSLNFGDTWENLGSFLMTDCFAKQINFFKMQTGQKRSHPLLPHQKRNKIPFIISEKLYK